MHIYFGPNLFGNLVWRWREEVLTELYGTWGTLWHFAALVVLCGTPGAFVVRSGTLRFVTRALIACYSSLGTSRYTTVQYFAVQYNTLRHLRYFGFFGHFAVLWAHVVLFGTVQALSGHLWFFAALCGFWALCGVAYVSGVTLDALRQLLFEHSSDLGLGWYFTALSGHL